MVAFQNPTPLRAVACGSLTVEGAGTLPAAQSNDPSNRRKLWPEVRQILTAGGQTLMTASPAMFA